MERYAFPTAAALRAAEVPVVDYTEEKISRELQQRVRDRITHDVLAAKDPVLTDFLSHRGAPEFEAAAQDENILFDFVMFCEEAELAQIKEFSRKALHDQLRVSVPIYEAFRKDFAG